MGIFKYLSTIREGQRWPTPSIFKWKLIWRWQFVQLLHLIARRHTSRCDVSIKNCHFPYTKSVHGEGEGANFEATHFMDGPLCMAPYGWGFLQNYLLLKKASSNKMLIIFNMVWTFKINIQMGFSVYLIPENTLEGGGGDSHLISNSVNEKAVCNLPALQLYRSCRRKRQRHDVPRHVAWVVSTFSPHLRQQGWLSRDQDGHRVLISQHFHEYP